MSNNFVGTYDEHLEKLLKTHLCLCGTAKKLIKIIIDDMKKAREELNNAQTKESELCPCGHIHEPSSSGKGLRTYCVEGSQCNSNKCKDFLKGGLDE